MRKVTAILLVVFFSLTLIAPVFAASKEVGQKLERGIKNLFLGWTEIPNTIVATSTTDGIFSGVIRGTVVGVLQAVARTLSGAVDVVTFPIGPHDDPALKPSMIDTADK